MPRPSYAPEINKAIGEKVRARRKTLGLSCDALAIQVGISNQQMHKYETAQSRISAELLYKLADILSVDMSYFFNTPDDGAGAGHSSLEIRQLEAAYMRISNRKLQKKVLTFIRSMADE